MKRLTHLWVLLLITLAVVGIAHAVQLGGTTYDEIFPGSHHHYYGGMTIFENATPQTIDVANKWHLVYVAGGWVTGLTNGFVYQDGAVDTVSDAFTNPGGGKVLVTCAGHPFAAGEVVSITGSANYDDVYVVEAPVGVNDFTITATFAVEAAAAQVVTRGGNLTVTNAGVYSVSYHTAEAPANGGDVFDFTLYKNAAAMEGSEMREEQKTAGNYSTPAGCDLFSAAAGDKISLATKNLSGAGNITFRYAHVMVLQL